MSDKKDELIELINKTLMQIKEVPANLSNDSEKLRNLSLYMTLLSHLDKQEAKRIKQLLRDEWAQRFDINTVSTHNAYGKRLNSFLKRLIKQPQFLSHDIDIVISHLLTLQQATTELLLDSKAQESLNKFINGEVKHYDKDWQKIEKQLTWFSLSGWHQLQLLGRTFLPSFVNRGNKELYQVLYYLDIFYGRQTAGRIVKDILEDKNISDANTSKAKFNHINTSLINCFLWLQARDKLTPFEQGQLRQFKIALNHFSERYQLDDCIKGVSDKDFLQSDSSPQRTPLQFYQRVPRISTSQRKQQIRRGKKIASVLSHGLSLILAPFKLILSRQDLYTALVNLFVKRNVFENLTGRQKALAILGIVLCLSAAIGLSALVGFAAAAALIALPIAIPTAAIVIPAVVLGAITTITSFAVFHRSWLAITNSNLPTTLKNFLAENELQIRPSFKQNAIGLFKFAAAATLSSVVAVASVVASIAIVSVTQITARQFITIGLTALVNNALAKVVTKASAWLNPKSSILNVADSNNTAESQAGESSEATDLTIKEPGTKASLEAMTTQKSSVEIPEEVRTAPSLISRFINGDPIYFLDGIKRLFFKGAIGSSVLVNAAAKGLTPSEDDTFTVRNSSYGHKTVSSHALIRHRFFENAIKQFYNKEDAATDSSDDEYTDTTDSAIDEDDVTDSLPLAKGKRPIENIDTTPTDPNSFVEVPLTPKAPSNNPGPT